MKVYFHLIEFILIIIINILNINTKDKNSNTNTNTNNNTNTNTNTDNKISNDIIPDIDLRNFDIRERFYNCYNPGYDADLIPKKACYQNWFVQFTLILTDKYCIMKDRSTKRILSPMNLISCINLLPDLKLNCGNSAQFYIDYNTAKDTISKTIDFFNKNGTLYLDENKYEIKPTLDFKDCSDYKSSVNFTVDNNFDEYDEKNDDEFKLIKYKLYTEGPLLAALQTTIDIYTSTEPIYSPIPKSQDDGIKFLRVFGWQTINGKHYWLFSFTKGIDWEIENYKLIASKDFGLKFLNIKLNIIELN